MTSPSDKSPAYPSPAIVVGLGRFGLKLLERLGDDWQAQSRAIDDPSLKNVRLVHVRPDSQVAHTAWRAGEQQTVEIARYTGDGDLPTLAVDFTILRSLGLIRYRNGAYQVAAPRDGGVVEVPAAGPSDTDTPDNSLARRRYFDWTSLSPDPITSVEQLRVLKARQSDLDLFITPLVNRIRQGHSPRAVLACISRCRALADGRDPCPWGWLRPTLVDQHGLDEPAETGGSRVARVSVAADWLNPMDVGGFLDGLAGEPLDGWSDWAGSVRPDGIRDGPDAAAGLTGPFELSLPEAFIPQVSDLGAPITPLDLLKVDWETTGWATRHMSDSGTVEFDPVAVSPFRLGLFDHDDCSRIHQTHSRDFAERLRELSIHAHRGLVRMWVDLQRERVDSPDEKRQADRRRDNVDRALDQSLEVLGELLVRPLVTERIADEMAQAGAADDADMSADDYRAHSQELGFDEQASSFLGNLIIEEAPSENAARNAVDGRLADLGFAVRPPNDGHRLLFGDVALRPEDLYFEPDENTVVDPDVLNQSSRGLLDLRTMLNDRTRQLFDRSFLEEYRDKPSQRVPRLTIYVVCDVAEAFARSSLRTVLREIHAELLRAFGPIFESYRQGFDRALSVVPIVWMPHPADSFGGEHPLGNRCEEAAIIESIQGVRRWAESAPRGKRCIPQILINSRVTDHAVLNVWDSLRQTRDFLNFQMRNDLSADPWLRRTATGAASEDLFASFNCREIEFPAEQAREYLANRYARHSLARLRSGEGGPLAEGSDEPIEPPSIEALVSAPAARLGEQTGRVADTMSQKVTGRLNVAPSTTVDRVEAEFDETFGQQLLEQIHHHWQSLTRRRGDMDDMVDELRRDTSARLADTLEVVEDAGDRLIEDQAGKGGLERALAGFGELHALSRRRLRDQEAERRRKESMCLDHRIPQTGRVGDTRREVVDQAGHKPEAAPMRIGLVIWAVMAPAMGAPVAWAIAKGFELHLEPNAFEYILGPWGPLVGGLMLFLPVFMALRWYMNRRVERLQAAVDAMADAVGRVVDGGPHALGEAPSIRSFMEARLVHMATLAARNYARQIHEHVGRDLESASRLRRSVDLQLDVLMRRAEDAGVHVDTTDLDAAGGDDDLSQLFEPRSEAAIDTLIDPDHLGDYYRRRIGGDDEIDELLERFIDGVGGFDNWRRVAPLSDTMRILRVARTMFDPLVDHPVSVQFDFEDEVRRRLVEFVSTNVSQISVGAKFSGYEGIDPDGVDELAGCALVVHPSLKPVFEQAFQSMETPASLESVEIRTAPIEPNGVYLLSLIQSIRPHSVRNLRRFESFHHRAQMPDDRTFPLSGGGHEGPASRPINHLTGYDSLRESISRDIFQIARDIEDQSLADGARFEPPAAERLPPRDEPGGASADARGGDDE